METTTDDEEVDIQAPKNYRRYLEVERRAMASELESLLGRWMSESESGGERGGGAPLPDRFFAS